MTPKVYHAPQGAEQYDIMAAGMFRQLLVDRPSVAATFGTDYALYTSDDVDPGHVYAPESYVQRVAAAIKAAFAFELSYPSYSALTAEQQAQYDKAWADVYDILPDYVQQDIPTYKEDEWDQFTAEGLYEGIAKATAREEALKQRMN